VVIFVILSQKYSKMQQQHNANDDDVEYDGNCFELKFDSSKGTWQSTMNLMSGNMWPKKNFRMASGSNNNNNNNNRRNRSLIDEFIDLISNENSIFYSLTGVMLLVGYLIYRYLYLKKRVSKLDRVDVALMNRFHFNSSMR
jgi:hypothetical protein